MRHDVDEYDLPAPSKVVERLKANSDSFANLVTMPPDAIVERLRNRLDFENQAFLAHLAKAMLDLPLTCLSVYFTHCWLTFNADDVPLHFPGLGDIPSSLYEKYPVRSVPGLEEFLRYFGDMAVGILPTAGFFWDPAQAVIVSREDVSMSWGMVDGWEGSLSIYHGSTGDIIVLHPDGYPGIWRHEIGWGSNRESPFVRLDFSFPELIVHFSEYLALPSESPEQQASPFYC